MDKLYSIFQNHIENGLCQGLEWRVKNKNKVSEGKVGYLDLDKKTSILNNSIYRIWSMTKPIVSIGILLLVEENKINLYDPINKFLPIFDKLKVLVNESSSVEEVKNVEKMPTIKDLLLHTAGFSYNFFEDEIAKEYSKKKIFYSSESTLEEEINILASCPLLFEPSTKWHYSVSIDVLARIIEIVSTDSLQNFLYERIFEPLEMFDTGFTIKKSEQYRLMTTYEYDANHKKLSLPNVHKINLYGYPLNNPNYARGGHGLYSSLIDFSNFSEMLLSGQSKSGKTIISKKMLNLAKINHLDEKFFPLEIKIPGNQDDENDLEPYGWGLGFRVLKNLNKSKFIKSIGEFGWSGAASTFFLVDPENSLTAVLMTQVLNGEKALREDFLKEIYHSL
tara:strand:+ start:746 stop:1921 length:1176 start_codon:yes stop_codon:yes gene_type:complete